MKRSMRLDVYVEAYDGAGYNRLIYNSNPLVDTGWADGIDNFYQPQVLQPGVHRLRLSHFNNQGGRRACLDRPDPYRSAGRGRRRHERSLGDR